MVCIFLVLVGCGIHVDFFRSSQVFFEVVFVIFFAILFPARSPVASAVFWVAVFEEVSKASVTNVSRLLSILAGQVLPMFFVKDKNT